MVCGLVVASALGGDGRRGGGVGGVKGRADDGLPFASELRWSSSLAVDYEVLLVSLLLLLFLSEVKRGVVMRYGGQDIGGYMFITSEIARRIPKYKNINHVHERHPSSCCQGENKWVRGI